MRPALACGAIGTECTARTRPGTMHVSGRSAGNERLTGGTCWARTSVRKTRRFVRRRAVMVGRACSAGGVGTGVARFVAFSCGTSSLGPTHTDLVVRCYVELA